MGTDTAAAAQSDRIADTVDYSTVSKRVIERVERSSYQLLESLAEAVAACVLQDAGVQTVRVRIEKPRSHLLLRTFYEITPKSRGKNCGTVAKYPAQSKKYLNENPIPNRSFFNLVLPYVDPVSLWDC